MQTTKIPEKNFEFQIHKPSTPQNKGKLLPFLVIPMSLLFLELAAHSFAFGFAPNWGFLFIPLAAFCIGTFLSFLTFLAPAHTRYVLTAVLLGFFGIYFSFHLIYFSSQRVFFSWQTIGLAGDVTQFWRETVMICLRNSYKIFISVLPFVLYLIFGKKLFLYEYKSNISALVNLAASLVFAALFSAGLCIVSIARFSFFHINVDAASTYRRFGVLVSSSIDIEQCIFGETLEKVENPYAMTSSITDVYDKNVLPIDFDSLIHSAPDEEIAEMHRYFSSVPATSKNQYTGMFKGKNLIFLSLEAFSPMAIDKDRTPTLYKMYTEGFRFNNFYDTLWGGSTATGEYSNMTGNLYTTADCLSLSAETLQYFSLGNLFRRAGYPAYAYHNHTYTYYDRDRSHPNFGYNYKAIGNGLVLEKTSWPNSDLQMAKATIGDYISSDTPFHAYYMTVSGHANFSWTENDISALHRDVVDSLNYSEKVKAYLAAQYDVELMLEELVNQLEAAGKLNDTVFAMCPDHYPYALSDSQLSELYGISKHNIRNNFELYRSSFILWTPDMVSVSVDTPCSSIDIVPTLANLFDIDYDSRLITGKDILSDTEKIVLINTMGNGSSWNWITSEGTYNTARHKFYPSNNCSIAKEDRKAYVRLTNKKVAAMRHYSKRILNRDYYSYVFAKNDS